MNIVRQPDGVTLYRRRYKPLEIVHLKDDELLYWDENLLITKWKVLKPRKDLGRGYSCYYLADGFKVSYFISPDDSFLYWYCDIIETIYNGEKNEYIFNDLLIDVIIDKNDRVKVVDVADVADTLTDGRITLEQAKAALYALDKLLQIIDSGEFGKLTETLRAYIE